MNTGYLYVASGAQYVREAINSLVSLRRCDPDAHVTLVTDQPVSFDGFDLVTVLDPSADTDDNRAEGFAFKTRAIRYSPYKKTFFVDTDTYFCGNCRELFGLLDHYDLLLAHAPSDISRARIGAEELAGYYPYNTGVLVFGKSEKTDQLLEDWEHIYRRRLKQYPSDQTAFMEALIQHDIKLYVLQPNYNFRLPFFVCVPGKRIKLLHGRADNFEKIAAVVNESDRHRSWNPLTQKMTCSVPPKRRTRSRRTRFKGAVKRWEDMAARLKGLY